MIKITPLNIAELSSKEKQEWCHLIEKKYWLCLDGKDPWDVSTAAIYAIGATHQDKPVGIALATLRTAMGHALLLSLYVEPDFRNRKIASQLLSQFEVILLELECQLISHIYASDHPTTPYLEKILKKLDWSDGVPFSFRCHFQALEFHPQWLHRKYRFPKGFELFLWKHLTLKERKQINYQLENERIPPSVSPFHRESTIEPINSLGIRKDGEVIGWMIVNRIDHETLQYSSLFIQRDYQFLGFSVYMLAASILLQQKAMIEKSIMDVNLEESEQSWLDFIKKRLLPGTSRVERFKESFHNIGNKYPVDERDMWEDNLI